jgi:hypothetical protein
MRVGKDGIQLKGRYGLTWADGGGGQHDVCERPFARQALPIGWLGWLVQAHADRSGPSRTASKKISRRLPQTPSGSPLPSHPAWDAFLDRPVSHPAHESLMRL